MSDISGFMVGVGGIVEEDWFQTEIKPRFCKPSENYFLGSYLKVRVKLP